MEPREFISSEPVEKGEDTFSPSGYLAITIKDEVREKFEKWMGSHLSAIKQAMGEELARFEEEKNQHDGKVTAGDYPYSGAFRVAYPLTKKKSREASNRNKQAYLDSDPIFAVTYSGDMKGEEGAKLADRIERGLDTAIDSHLECLDDFAHAIFNATLHGIGILIPSWKYQEAIRKDLEKWRGFDGLTEASMTDLIRFEDQYPDWNKTPDLKSIHIRLEKGETVEREITFKEPVRNCPDFLSVDPWNVRVYPWVDGYEGLRSTPCYGYVQKFRLYELQEMQEAGQLDEGAVERLIKKRQPDLPDDADSQNEEYEVFIGTCTYSLESDERAIYKVFYEVESGTLLRVRSFPWWYGEPDLIPLYIREEEKGFYKRGLAWDLKDDTLILTVLLCMYLNGVDMANSMRLRVKDKSLAQRHLLSGKWSPRLGIPWKGSPNEVDSLAQPMAHLSSILESMSVMAKNADNSTNTSEYQSGRESPNDPTAPASKVALLLKQVEPNQKEFIRSLEPSFRKVGRYLLWLYYQGLKLGWIKEIPGAEGVTADDIAKVKDNLNPRALLFEAEKSDELQRNSAVIALLEKHLPGSPLFTRALKMLLSSMGSQWARIVNSLPPEAFQPAPPAQPPVPGMGGGMKPALPAMGGNGKQPVMPGMIQ